MTGSSMSFRPGPRQWLRSSGAAGFDTYSLKAPRHGAGHRSGGRREDCRRGQSALLPSPTLSASGPGKFLSRNQRARTGSRS